MVIANESLEVSAFHLITFKEPIGCFPFIKGGNIPEELMSFFIVLGMRIKFHKNNSPNGHLH